MTDKTPHEVIEAALFDGDTLEISADKVLTALSAAGFVIVPREPTEAMLNAAIDAHGLKLGDISALGFRMSPQRMFALSYAAMLAAAEEKPDADR